MNYQQLAFRSAGVQMVFIVPSEYSRYSDLRSFLGALVIIKPALQLGPTSLIGRDLIWFVPPDVDARSTL